MGPFITKDFLVYWRDRKEILMALLLPIVLIVVLNFAFAGVFNQDENSMQIDVAIVQEDDPPVGLEAFKETVKASDLSRVEKETTLKQTEHFSPNGLILDFFNNPEMKEWVSTQELSEEEATELVDNGEIDAIVTIPDGFTNDVLSTLMLGEKSGATLSIQAAEESIEVTTLQNIVTDYINTLNLQGALGSAVQTGEEPELPQGGREIVEGVETFTMAQYFTIAIGTLFALFIAQTIAIKTVTEKRERVFNRILLTNSNPLNYLMGKTVSTFCMTWLQMMITFTVIQLLLDVFPGKPLAFWFGLLAVITAFAITVAGLSALFTAITLNLHDPNAANGLSTLIIMALGVLGGSFFPLQALPKVFQTVGEWTPNGLTQVVLIEWIQFGNVQDIILPVGMLILFFIVCFAVGIAIFPRRGRI